MENMITNNLSVQNNWLEEFGFTTTTTAPTTQLELVLNTSPDKQIIVMDFTKNGGNYRLIPNQQISSKTAYSI